MSRKFCVDQTDACSQIANLTMRDCRSLVNPSKLNFSFRMRIENQARFLPSRSDTAASANNSRIARNLNGEKQSPACLPGMYQGFIGVAQQFNPESFRRLHPFAQRYSSVSESQQRAKSVKHQAYGAFAGSELVAVSLAILASAGTTLLI